MRPAALLLALLLASCAHTSGGGGGEVVGLVRGARISCDALRGHRGVKVKPVVKIDARLARIARARQRGSDEQAARLARNLHIACHQEHKQRVDLAAQVKLLQGQRLAPQHAAHYNGLIYAGRFSDAILCGEALLASNYTGCPPLPPGAAAVTPSARSSAPAPAPPAQSQADAAFGTQAEAAWAAPGGKKKPRGALTRAAAPPATPPADQTWREADHDEGIDERATLGYGYPLNAYLLPVLSGTLRSRADLLFSYSSVEDSSVLTLALDLRYAADDRVELGLTVPVLTKGHALGLAGAFDDVAFGNLEARLKIRLWGSSTGLAVVSLYVEGVAPTMAFYDSDRTIDSRAFGQLRYGAAAAAQLLGRLALGGGTGQNWTILGDSRHDLISHQLDLWGLFYLHRVVAVQLALQFDILFHYAGSGYDDEVGFMLLPAVQLFPAPRMHIDLGARIAATDGGKRVTGGRAALLFGLGYLF